MGRRFVVLLAGLLLLTGGPALAAVNTPAGPGQQEGTSFAGEIVDFEILPPDQPLSVGDSIVFTNNGARPHTVTDRGGLFDTDPILPGTTGEITFSVPGSYEVFCRINPSRMNALVNVVEGPEVSRRVRVQAYDENREGETKRFDPAQLEVQPGTQILLANVGGLPHTMTAADGSFTTGTVDPGPEGGRFAGSTGEIIVDEPGTYEFFCEIHPQAMRGTLVVSGEPLRGTTTTTAGGDGDGEQANVAAEATAAVDIADFEFSQTEVAVAPGGEITWQNTGEAPHTATFDDVPLDTGRIEPGNSASLTAPDEPGTYSYFCAIHPSMRGAILVPAAGQDDGEAADDEDETTTTGEGAAEEDEAAAQAADAGDGDDDGGLASGLAIGFGVVLVAAGVIALALALRRREA